MPRRYFLTINEVIQAINASTETDADGNTLKIDAEKLNVNLGSVGGWIINRGSISGYSAGTAIVFATPYTSATSYIFIALMKQTVGLVSEGTVGDGTRTKDGITIYTPEGEEGVPVEYLAVGV